MDPDANLREQRKLVEEIIDEATESAQDIVRLAELVDALDLWLQRGGALPHDWARAG